VTDWKKALEQLAIAFLEHIDHDSETPPTYTYILTGSSARVVGRRGVVQGSHRLCCETAYARASA